MIDLILDKFRLHKGTSPVIFGGFGKEDKLIPIQPIEIELLGATIGLGFVNAFSGFTSESKEHAIYRDPEWSEECKVGYAFSGLYLGDGFYQAELTLDTPQEECIAWCKFPVCLVRNASVNISPFSFMTPSYGQMQCSYYLCWTMKMPDLLQQYGVKWKPIDLSEKEGTFNPMFPLTGFDRLPHRLLEPPVGVGSKNLKNWDKKKSVLRNAGLDLVTVDADEISGVIAESMFCRSLSPAADNYDFTDFDYTKMPTQDIQHDAEGRMSIKKWFDEEGNIEGIKRYLYDPSGNLQYEFEYWGDKKLEEALRYSYSDGKRITKREYHIGDGNRADFPGPEDVERVVDMLLSHESWSEERYSYDQDGRLIKTDFVFWRCPNPPYHYLETYYDSYGRVAEERKFFRTGVLDYRRIVAYSKESKEPIIEINEVEGGIRDITVYDK